MNITVEVRATAGDLIGHVLVPLWWEEKRQPLMVILENPGERDALLRGEDIDPSHETMTLLPERRRDRSGISWHFVVADGDLPNLDRVRTFQRV